MRFARPALLALSVLLLCRGIAAPFNGWHDLNSAMYAQFARNHVQYGLRYTALYCTWGDSAAAPEAAQRYLNHPPLIALWTALPLVAFGDHEWAFRLVPIAATLGSATLLMTILCRLGGPTLAALGGFFFVALPSVVYFGRMIDHIAPVQFFSLWMVHSYLQWAGDYESRPGARAGIIYALAVVLGIGTGWGVVLVAGLLWSWHAVRVLRGSGEARLLAWMAAAPLLALAAVVLHIAAACHWDFGVLTELMGRRSLGGEGGRAPWLAWLAVQWRYLLRNFTPVGAAAALAAGPALIVSAFLRRRAQTGAPAFPLAGPVAAPVSLLGLQGLLYVVVFKNQSWWHDYWQLLLAPFVASAMAAFAILIARLSAQASRRLATVVVTVMLAAPMPWAAAALDFYTSRQLVDPRQIETLARLHELVPTRAPACTSHRPKDFSETIGSYLNRSSHPVITYYAERPLFFSRSLEELQANAHHCVAYVLQRSDQPWANDLARSLSASFEAVPVGDHHVIFRLDRPLSSAAGGRPGR